MAAQSTFSFQQMKFEYVSSDEEIWSCCLVVKNFGSKNFLADVYSCGLCCSNAFNLHITVTVQFLLYVIFLDLIDTWHESIHKMLRTNFVKLNTLFRQYVALQWDFVPLHWISQTSYLLIRWNWFAWNFFLRPLTPC